MAVKAFSDKQRQVMDWWCDASPWRDWDAIICEGAIRSGKTFCMGLSFFCWAMKRFQGEQFALCGKTMGALRRNLISRLRPVLKELGFSVREIKSQNILKVRFGGRENTFYLFGGMGENSADTIQGATLAGALLDEVVLLPRSLVEQAVARCSVEGAKVWFSCNPGSPEHWFYREWVSRAEERRALRVRFVMKDNPSLSPAVLERYERSFQGNFYRRYILGQWVGAQGLVYDFFDRGMVERVPAGEMERWRISCDYGTVNPMSMGLWGRRDGIWYRVKEFYYDSRKEGRQKTDLEYVADLEALAAGRPIERVVVDPSAASFITALEQRGWKVCPAENEVLSGIRVTADLLRQRKLVICEGCEDAIREFSLYHWDEKAVGDRVVKRDDHAMDDIRYFAVSLGKRERFIGGFGVERTGW